MDSLYPLCCAVLCCLAFGVCVGVCVCINKCMFVDCESFSGTSWMDFRFFCFVLAAFRIDLSHFLCVVDIIDFLGFWPAGINHSRKCIHVTVLQLLKRRMSSKFALLKCFLFFFALFAAVFVLVYFVCVCRIFHSFSIWAVD